MLESRPGQLEILERGPEKAIVDIVPGDLSAFGGMVRHHDVVAIFVEVVGLDQSDERRTLDQAAPEGSQPIRKTGCTQPVGQKTRHFLQQNLRTADN